MKSAVLKQLGTTPCYDDFQDPIPTNTDHLLMTVKAASIKNLDKARASGAHYASYKEFPVVVGIDGVGVLENGTTVYAQGVTGMIGEKALISKERYTVVPEALDVSLAAALPNAVLGATIALRNRAKMHTGNVVLINGATGVTGQLAVQVAKHYGAAKVIVTGRSSERLEKLHNLGADVSISLAQEDGAIVQQLQQLHREAPIDIVLDYIWGHPVELIIQSLKGEGVHSVSHPVTIVTVGDMAGKTIALGSGTLRSSDITLLGSGLGSLSRQDLREFDTEVLPEMFQLAVSGGLTLDIHEEQLENIEHAWNAEVDGKRVVVRIG